MRKAAWLLAALGVGALLGCQSFGTDGPTSSQLLNTPSTGFSKEIDEPTSRGTVRRISPEQIDVAGRLALSHDWATIVYSGRQQSYSASDEILYRNDTPAKVYDLWKISISGGAPVKLTSGSTEHFWSPSFTADGNSIVYESRGQLWKVRADGAGGKTRIPGSGGDLDKWPHVSLDDRVVFCSIEGDKSTIWTVNISGGELTQLREGMTPRWSPDGKQICFSYQDDIWLIGSDGTNMVQLTSTSKTSEGLPSFSPDGKSIVFVSNEGKSEAKTSDYNIWTMKADGTEKIQLTELDSWDSWPIWASNGIYFLSGRGVGKDKYTRIWYRPAE